MIAVNVVTTITIDLCESSNYRRVVVDMHSISLSHSRLEGPQKHPDWLQMR